MSESIISLEHVSYSYLTGTPHETVALRDANLRVAEGEIAALVGPSGSGKSTLVAFCNGLLIPALRGQASILGQDTADPGTDLAALRAQVGLVMQYPHQQLFERYVGDDVAYGPRQLGLAGGALRERVRQAMEAVGLDYMTFVDRRTFALSGGEMRRAALAGVLAMQPRILVLDEATAGLDQPGRHQVHALLRRLRDEQGLTLLLVSNEMDEVAELADSVTVLYRGTTVAQGPTREIITDAQLMASCGLCLPEVTEIAGDLGRAGLPIPADLLTAGQVEEAVWQALRH